MSADGGLLMMLIGGLMLVASLTERVIAQHRWLASTVQTTLDPALRAAFPSPPTAWELERRLADAAAAVESAELCRQRQRRTRH